MHEDGNESAGQHRPEKASVAPKRAFARRVFRWAGIAMLILLGLALIIVVLLSLQPVRSSILRRGLAELDANLPGNVTAARTTWRGWMTLELHDLIWADGADTLLQADRLMASLPVGRLLQRDLVADSIRIDRLRLDVPAIQARLGIAASEPKEEPAGSGVPYLREGAIRGLPSIALHHVRADAPWIRLDSETELRDLLIAGGADLLRGGDGIILLERAQASMPSRETELEAGALRLNLGRGTIEGEARGHYTGAWPFALLADSPERDAIRITVTPPDSPPPPDGTGLMATATILRSGGRLSGADLDLHLRTPGTAALARDPALASRLARWPDIDGIGLAARGRVALDPQFRVDLNITLEPAEFLESGAASVRLASDTIRVERLDLTLNGLSVKGHVRRVGDHHDTRLDLRADNVRWLAPFVLGRLPDSLQATASVQLIGPVTEPAATAVIGCRTRFGSVHVDTLIVNATTTPGAPRTLRYALMTRAVGLELDGSGSISVPTPAPSPEPGATRLVAAITPFRIRRLGAAPFAPPALPALRDPSATAPTTVRYDTDRRRVFVDGRLLEGDAGTLRAHGEVGLSSGGEVRATLAWPAPPRALLAFLPEARARLDTLWASWPLEVSPTIDLRARFRPHGGALALDGTAHARLPGPRTFAPLVPPTWDLEDLGPVVADLAITQTPDPRGLITRIDLSMDDTPWIQRGIIRVRHAPGRTILDTLSLALDGLSAEGAGALEAETLSGGFRCRLDDRSLRRVIPTLPRDLNLDAEVVGSLKGTPRTPSLGTRVRAGIETTRLRIPTLEAQITLEHARRGRVRLLAEGPDLAVRHAGSFEIGDTVSVLTDTLEVRLIDRDLAAVRPSRVTFVPEAGEIVLEDLELAGTLGRVQAALHNTPRQFHLRADAVLTPPSRPQWLSVPSGLWPAQVEMSGTATTDTLGANARISGVTLGNQHDLVATVRTACRRDRAEVEMDLAGDRTVATASATLPVAFDQFPRGARLASDSVRVNVALSDFRLPGRIASAPAWEAYLEGTEGARESRLDGEITMVGPAARPAIGIKAGLMFPDWPQLSTYALTLRGDNAAGDALHAELQLASADRPMATARLSWPVRFSLTPPLLARSGDPLDFSLEAEKLRLDDFNPVLPGAVTLDGEASLKLSAKGKPENPVIAGQFLLTPLRVTLPEQSRVTARGDVRLDGTAREPRVRGTIRLENAVLRIPEAQRDLLPAGGTATLWADSLFPAGRHDHARQDKPATAPADDAEEIQADIDLRVQVPPGSWIRGRGIEMEITGELEIAIRRNLPVLVGRLIPIRGRLDLLGRRFSVDGGEVSFYGETEFNPRFDVALSTTVEDVVIRVRLSGSAAQPELTFSSEPEMSEGDIFAYLLFGKPLDELDHAQTNLLESRAVGVAQSFAVERITATLARQLRVDLLSFRQERGAAGGSYLVVGKYLSRRALLKYESEVEHGREYGINLEYWLARRFKLDTYINRYRQSGADLNWSREY